MGCHMLRIVAVKFALLKNSNNIISLREHQLSPATHLFVQQHLPLLMSHFILPPNCSKGRILLDSRLKFNRPDSLRVSLHNQQAVLSLRSSVKRTTSIDGTDVVQLQ